ncbi:MAG: UDP-N-acetylmuramoyl-tripeptide--D-alanyl-D-alanine ligase [bacterium]|nr:UDP-N-acetylmuramoyl-tripeptide--D-alanyl-D-alanine ligase [Candidatus Margulisiibacteriota bacterium]
MFTLKEILETTKCSRVLGTRDQVLGISTDSRTTKAGELFIPLKGPKHNGRKFIKQALAKGAIVLDTKNGLAALQDIAAYHRQKFNIPIIGVTGSVGKTTTKDMIAAILAQEMKVLKTEENYNNEIGVPLTLLQLTKKHQAAVIEMGMQGLGEIELIAKIARPTISVVTNIGESHLQYLKTRKNIATAKAEIFKFQTKKDSAVINADDEFFEHLKSNVRCPRSKVITFGLVEKAQVTPKELMGIKLPLPGEHNIYNALAAIAVAKILKIKRKSIKKGLESFRPSTNRYDVINRPDKVKIINDTYNASPKSMAAMLDVLSCLPGRKIAVLGDMYELGKRTRPAHKKIGQLARRLGVNILITVGKLAKDMKGTYHFASKKSVVKKLKKIIRPGDRLLIKASHGLHLEEVVEAIRQI